MRLRDVKKVRELLVGNVHRPALPDALYADIARTGALLHGHFALQSGEHSEYFLRFSQIGWEPTVLRSVASLLLERPPFEVEGRVILCSESAGLFLGNAIARQQNSRLAVLKVDMRKRPTDALREGVLKQGDRVIVVNDVVTQGQTLDFFLRWTREQNVEVEGVLAFASLKPQVFTTRLQAAKLQATWLVEARWPTFKPEQGCPLCERGEPLFPGFELA